MFQTLCLFKSVYLETVSYGVNIFTLNAKDYDYKADKIPYMQTAYKENVVNIINLLAVEDFALKDPLSSKFM